MPFQFCPQCGTKLQPDFKFCPSCGERIACGHDELVPVRMTTSLGFSLPEKDGTSVSETGLALSPKHEPTKGKSKYVYSFTECSVLHKVCVSVYRAGELSLTLSHRSNMYHIRSSCNSFSSATGPTVPPPGKGDL